LPSANFYCLLAYCRRGCGDLSGAMVALHKALEAEPDHAAALAALAVD
jgi:cytochrome c-type biogenesis protein CcmH/NrfG